MKRLLVAIAVSTLVATSCGSDSDSTGDTVADDAVATDTVAADTVATDTVAADTIAADPEPDETTPEDDPVAEDDGVPEPDITDPAVAEGGPEDLAITEVVFDDHVTITNLGSAAVSVDGLWLCNRPNYVPMPTALLAPGESIQITDFFLPASVGEVALYTSNNFGDSAAIIDYVGWGAGGGRASVADAAGIWPADDTVAVPSGGASISAPSGGSSSADWS